MGFSLPPAISRPQTALQLFEATGANPWYLECMTVLGDYRQVTATARSKARLPPGVPRPVTSFQSKLSYSESSPAVPPVSEPPSKDPLSGYTLGVTLGQGSFAVVHKAVSKATALPVAIKTYAKSRLIDETRKRNVHFEAQILSGLKHRNIVKLVEKIETKTHIYLVMEYIEGLNLQDLLKNKDKKRLNDAEAKEIFSQIIDGVSYLHENNVAHRDLKLQNVLLDASGTVKITDFGFAMETNGSEKVKMYCGTPSYMAPEIVERAEYRLFPADIWAAGVLLYAILCGELPFAGLNDRELGRRIVSGRVSVPAWVNSHAREMIEAMLTVDPLVRPIARTVKGFQWLSREIKRRTSANDRRQHPGNPLDAYDVRVISRLRNLGYPDSDLQRDLGNSSSHLHSLYTHLSHLKSTAK